MILFFFFSSRRRHTRWTGDWSSDVCSSDLVDVADAGEAVTAHFADGTQASADVLIGADGIRSTVRSLIDPAAPQPRYAGLVSFGARVNDTGLASTGGKMHMVFGKRAFFGYQVLDDGSGGWFVNLPHRAPMA